MNLETEVFFCVAELRPDGTLAEVGGKMRKWPDRAAFEAERRGRRATLIIDVPQGTETFKEIQK